MTSLTQAAPSFCARRGAVSLPRRVEPTSTTLAPAAAAIWARAAATASAGRPSKTASSLTNTRSAPAAPSSAAAAFAPSPSAAADTPSPSSFAILRPAASSSRAVSVLSL